MLLLSVCFCTSEGEICALIIMVIIIGPRDSKDAIKSSEEVEFELATESVLSMWRGASTGYHACAIKPALSDAIVIRS